MQYLCVLGCLLVTFSGALSHGQTGQTGQTGSWNPWNQNNIWNQNQNGWNQGTWNHQGGGMQPNILAQILGGLGQGGQGTGGMGGMGQGQGGMGQGQGGMNQNNIMNSLIQMLMIKPLLEKLGGDKHADDKDDMDKMYDGFNKGRMTYEMLNQIAAFTEFKEAEKEFGEAMKALCGMVDGTYKWAKENDVEMFNKTDGDFMDKLESKTEHMSEEEKYEHLVTWLEAGHENKDSTFHEVFFKMATWSCMTGHKYMEAGLKKERIERGESECDDRK